MVIKGQGLCKLVVEAAHLPNDNSETNIYEVLLKREIYFYPPPQDSWYSNLRTLEQRKKREIRLKSTTYQLIDNILFRKNSDGVLLRCLDKDETEMILKELYSGSAHGHFGGETTAHKILRVGYYWPTLF